MCSVLAFSLISLLISDSLVIIVGSIIASTGGASFGNISYFVILSLLLTMGKVRALFFIEESSGRRYREKWSERLDDVEMHREENLTCEKDEGWNNEIKTDSMVGSNEIVVTEGKEEE